MKRFVAVGLATIALVLATECTSFAKGKSSFGSTSSRSSSVYVRGHTTKSGLMFLLTAGPTLIVPSVTIGVRSRT